MAVGWHKPAHGHTSSMIYRYLVTDLLVPTHLPGERMGSPGGRAVGCPSAACSAVSRSAPRLRAVSSTVVTSAWASAPHSERKPPVTFRCTTECRSACSDALFVGGTAAS